MGVRYVVGTVCFNAGERLTKPGSYPSLTCVLGTHSKIVGRFLNLCSPRLQRELLIEEDPKSKDTEIRAKLYLVRKYSPTCLVQKRRLNHFRIRPAPGRGATTSLIVVLKNKKHYHHHRHHHHHHHHHCRQQQGPQSLSKIEETGTCGGLGQLSI